MTPRPFILLSSDMGTNSLNPAIGYLGWIIIGALAGWIGSRSWR